jgi:biofilm PGA synthesis lipoprotein PgaB
VRTWIAIALSILAAGSKAGTPAPDFQVIAYHNVRDFVREDIDSDQYAVSTRNLIDQFTWLQVNGFTPVSVNDLLRARDGQSRLPDKAVLLTFDDGLKSVYTHVYPLLKLFGYPAVISIVTGWTTGDSQPGAADPPVTDYEFLSWEEVREMQASGLVEIASHTHDLHRGVIANPQNNELPAAVSRVYRNGAYESETAYLARIAQDIDTSARLIRENTGHAPRVITWPYGAYNAEVAKIAQQEGMPISLTLRPLDNRVSDVSVIGRQLMLGNPMIDDFGYSLLHPQSKPVLRVAQVDLDYIYDENPAQQEQNLSNLLDRIKLLEISHVFLQAFADPDADGGAQALYFPNRHLPMRADLFSRVAWQLKTRSDVAVFAWLPILSFSGSQIDDAWRVMQWSDGSVSFDADSEPRLSPFVPEARQLIREIYEDLAIYAQFDGILFHDDGRLNELEDANPKALEAYRREYGKALSRDRLQLDTAERAAWSRFKTEAIVDLTQTLAATVREYHPDALTARNLFSGAVIDPHGEVYLAQDFDVFADTYDYIALMAMPYLEHRPNSTRYYEDLVDGVSQHAAGFAKTIFELQTVDWRTNQPIPADDLRRTMRWLQSLGVRHIGYYPDDFILGHPDLRELKRGISLARYPMGELP